MYTIKSIGYKAYVGTTNDLMRIAKELEDDGTDFYVELTNEDGINRKVRPSHFGWDGHKQFKHWRRA